MFQITIAIIITAAILIIPMMIIATPFVITEYVRYSDRNKSEYEDNKKKHKIIKFVGSFETPNEYDLIGIWGLSEKHVIRKIKHLEQNGIFYDGTFAPLREVQHFPNYCEWII